MKSLVRLAVSILMCMGFSKHWIKWNIGRKMVAFGYNEEFANEIIDEILNE